MNDIIQYHTYICIDFSPEKLYIIMLVPWLAFSLFLSLDESEGDFLKHRSEMVPLPGLEPHLGCLLPLEERPHAVWQRPCRQPSFPGFLLLMHGSPLCVLGCASTFLRRSSYPACTLLLLVMRPSHPHRLSYSPALFPP